MNGLLCGQCFQLAVNAGVCGQCSSPVTQGATQALPVATVLDGKFVVGDVLGLPGGFGIAYLGWDRVLHRKVVLKELFPGDLVTRLPGDNAVRVIKRDQHQAFAQQRELFLDEARKLARLDGVAAVARVTHFFAENETAYFVMPYIPGRGLGSYVQGAGKLPLARVLHWFWPLAEGLAAIHRLGLIHRDIKPDNVLIDDDDRPVLIDFGNAASLATLRSKGQGFFAVSRHFGAPEQYANDTARMGAWTDVYALSGLLYYCLSGQRPTDAQQRQAGAELPSLQSLVPELPAVLVRAVDSGLAMDERQRPADIETLLQALTPLRPQGQHWSQALPPGTFGDRMRRVHQRVQAGERWTFSLNLWAGGLQWFWFAAHRLTWPAVASGLLLLAFVGLGLGTGSLPLALLMGWMLCALPCALFADGLQYRRVSIVGTSRPAGAADNHQATSAALATAGAADARSMLLGFIVPLAALLMSAWVADHEAGVRERVRQAIQVTDRRERVAAYVASHGVPPQSWDDLEAPFVPDSEIKHLALKAGVIEIVLGVSGAEDRRLRWRLGAGGTWVCEALDIEAPYTPEECRAIRP